MHFLPTHEWIRPAGDLVEIGITQIAADELTDVTYVKLPKVGATLERDKPFGEIESVKATSDLYSPVSGTVVEVNPALDADPGLVNREPTAAGWMMRVRPTGPDARSPKLLDQAAYQRATGH